MLLARRSRFQPFAGRRGDVLLALALAFPVLPTLVVLAHEHGQPALLLLALGSLGAILLRRERPAEALALAVAAAAVLPENRALVLPVLVVLYTIASRVSWRIAAAAGAGAAGVAIIAGAAWGSSNVGLLGYAIASTALCAAAVAVGLYVGARRRVIEGLRERAERLDRERELLAEQAVAQERVRIAQELHDIVAHNVSLMVVQAQALGATVGDDRVARGAGAIAELGRQAMTEMHTTLKLLRSDDSQTPELAPQPGLAQLERLIEQLREAGLRIELTIEGRPRPLAQGIDLSAFRIIQEALTNVVKHAAGASTRVKLAYQARGVELTVIDSQGEVRAALHPEPLEGHGLIGMRERAALFGGTLTTDALPDGFKVTATLPYGTSAS